MGRPKRISDAALLEATARVIARRGPVEFTIREVAQEAGLSPAAVMQRCKTKRGLVLALVEGGVQGVDQRFEQARKVEARPRDALRRALMEDARGLGHPVDAANHLTFLALELRDPEQRTQVQRHFRALRRRIQGLLQEAAALGQLPPGTDPATLVRSVEIAYHGALLLWTVEGKGRPEDAVAAALDALLPPGG